MQGGDQLTLPAGFRFHPTDDELVSHYLCRKCADQHISAPIIAEIDLYKFDPWDLPAMALYGEKEWYFFSPRDRKYPNGSRPNRMAGTGYWKATGADKPVGKPKTLGIKKALVFYAGKAPRGVKTNWIMHEYRLANVDRSAGIGKRNNLRLDDWVLCRLYNKKGTIEKHYNVDESEVQQWWDSEEQKPNLASSSHKRMNGTIYPSDSVSKMMQTESSSWEHVSSSSPDKEEVQSVPKWKEFDNFLDFQLNCTDASQSSQMHYNNDPFSVFPDMYGYMQKPY